MPPQRSALAYWLAPVVLATAPATLASASPLPSCAPAGASTLRSDGASGARLYARHGSLYGCLGTRRTLLGPLQATASHPATHVLRYALSGADAAIAEASMGVDTLSASVTLIDLRHGTTLATAPATSPSHRAESFSSVITLRVNAHATIAWIGRQSAIGAPTPHFEIHTLTPTTNTLRATTLTQPQQLKLTTTTLSWSINGQPTSIRL